MIKYIFSCAVLAISPLLLPIANAGQPDNSEENSIGHRFYVAGMFGQARGEVGAEEMNNRMTDLGYDAQAKVSHQDRSAWGLLAGYKWTPYFNLELGYTDLGKVTTRLSGSVVDIQDYLNSANVVHPRSADGVEVALLGHYPVTEKLHLYARAGAFFAQSSYDADSNTDTAHRSNSSGEFIYGAGVGYDITHRWQIRAGVNRYQIENENINLLGLTLLYQFSPFSDKQN